MFATEKQMSKKFELYVRVHFGNAYMKECKGLFGVPDYVFYDKNSKNTSIISFELKLKNWKQATKQAFRYKSFSHSSYVVLPASVSKLAEENIDFFKRYNIGLAIFGSEKEFEIIYKPSMEIPYSVELNTKVNELIGGSRKKSKNLEILVRKHSGVIA